MAFGESNRLALQPCPNRADCMVSASRPTARPDSCSDKYSRSALTLELRYGAVKCSMGRFFNKQHTFVNWKEIFFAMFSPFVVLSCLKCKELNRNRRELILICSCHFSNENTGRALSDKQVALIGSWWLNSFQFGRCPRHWLHLHLQLWALWRCFQRILRSSFLCLLVQ